MRKRSRHRDDRRHESYERHWSSSLQPHQAETLVSKAECRERATKLIQKVMSPLLGHTPT
jgi:hypothetical protein